MRNLGDREAQNIFELKVNKMLSGVSVEPAEVLNLSCFFDLALLGFPDRIPAEPFGSQ
jgi:hypothetical protein